MLGLILYLLFWSGMHLLVTCKFSSSCSNFYQVIFQNPTKNNLQNEDVLVNINTKRLLEANLIASCSDLIFVPDDSNENSPVASYWVENSCGLEFTRVWVNVESIPSSKTIRYFLHLNCTKDVKEKYQGEVVFDGEFFFLSSTECPFGFQGILPQFEDRLLFFQANESASVGPKGSASGVHFHSIQDRSNYCEAIDDKERAPLTSGPVSTKYYDHRHNYDEESSPTQLDETLPPYVKVKMCKSTILDHFVGSYVLFDRLLLSSSEYYEVKESFADKFLMVTNSTYKVEVFGGAETHTHSMPNPLPAATVTGMDDSDGAPSGSYPVLERDHEHLWDSNLLDPVSNIPSYVSVVMKQKVKEDNQVHSNSYVLASKVPQLGYVLATSSAVGSSSAFLRSSTTNTGARGGSETDPQRVHSHSYSLITYGKSASTTVGAVDLATVSGTPFCPDDQNGYHKHRLVGTSPLGQTELPRLDVLILQQKGRRVFVTIIEDESKWRKNETGKGGGGEKKTQFQIFMKDNWFMFFILFFVIVVVGCVVSGIILLLILNSQVKVAKQKSELKEFQELEDIDILVMENSLKKSGESADTPIIKKMDQRHFKIPYESIEILRLIESDSFSSTYSVLWNQNEVSFKLFSSASTQSALIKKEINVESELEISSSLSHPNILRFYGLCHHQNRLGYLYEYGEKLFEIFKLQDVDPRKRFDVDMKLRIARDVCTAMDLLHRKNIIHRGLNPQVIFLKDDFTAKVGGLSFSKIIGEDDNAAMTKKFTRSPYSAPELSTGNYSFESDYFSFGMFLFQLFFEVEREKLDRVSQERDFFFECIAETHELKSAFPRKLLDAIHKNISHNPRERLSFAKIMKLFPTNLSSKGKTEFRDSGIVNAESDGVWDRKVMLQERRIGELEKVLLVEKKKNEQLKFRVSKHRRSNIRKIQT